MEQEPADTCEDAILRRLERHYADLAAWLFRENRILEPTRLPDPIRPVIPPRVIVPARQPFSSRPK